MIDGGFADDVVPTGAEDAKLHIQVPKGLHVLDDGLIGYISSGKHNVIEAPDSHQVPQA